jgi:hypothetical protein
MDEERWFFSDFQRSLVLAELRRLREDVSGDGGFDGAGAELDGLCGREYAAAVCPYAGGCNGGFAAAATVDTSFTGGEYGVGRRKSRHGDY